ncbi:MAG: putative peptidoglycan lipid flippase [Frankiales bacterium]|nr:putative peptidoglycan lipid flippase [Frankiales bacterium]
MAERPGTSRELRRGAAGLAVMTIGSRLAGFARGLVFVRAVGATDVGDTYTRANSVPNIVFETVAGGALASSVVPVLAGPVERGDREQTLRTTAALLTWTVILLVPVSVAGVLLAHPMMELLTPAHVTGDRARAVSVGARMLAIFAPQIVLYGVGVVLTGVLQSHRRFLGPAIAPLLSSVVVAGTYVVYAVQTHAHPPTLATLTSAEELTLSVGTTVGVAVLSLSLLVPLHRAGVPLRVALEFPPGVRRRAARLALAGVAALAAQQLSLVVVLRLSYGGPSGTLVLYQLGWTVFLLPWAVLAVPLATSAFPHLVVRHGAGDLVGFTSLTAMTTRTVLLVCGAAGAVLVAAAQPIASVLVLHARGVQTPSTLAGAIAAFAPGLLGYGLVAHVGRALYACGQGRRAALATVTGWIAVLAGDLVLAAVTPSGRRLDVLAWGNTFGMTVGGVGLLLALSAEARSAVAGLTRTLPAVVVSAALSGGTGYLLAGWLEAPGLGRAVLNSAAVAAWVLAVYALVARSLDPVAVRSLLGRTEVVDG